MKPAPIAHFVHAASTKEACSKLSLEPGAAVAIAGGQSLVPMLALRLAPAETLVYLGRISELREISPLPGGGLRIGAAVTHAEIEDGELGDGSTARLMRRVARGIAYRAVRNHGTIGGSMALADPAADWPACLLALGASVRITGQGGEDGQSGERVEPIDTFLRGAYTTSLQSGEIITAFDVPEPGQGVRTGWQKVVRKSGAFAMSIGCVIVRPGQSASVVLGGTSTRPVAMPETATLVLRSLGASEEKLRRAIAGDLAAGASDADDYQRRLHTATLLKSIREALT